MLGALSSLFSLVWLFFWSAFLDLFWSVWVATCRYHHLSLDFFFPCLQFWWIWTSFNCFGLLELICVVGASMGFESDDGGPIAPPWNFCGKPVSCDLLENLAWKLKGIVDKLASIPPFGCLYIESWLSLIFPIGQSSLLSITWVQLLFLSFFFVFFNNVKLRILS